MASNAPAPTAAPRPRSTRDLLRGGTLGKAVSLSSEIVEIEGVGRFEVRQPTVSQRGEILRRSGAGVPGEDGRTSAPDVAALMVWAAIRCVHVPADATLEDGSPDPDAGAAVFTAADEEVLSGQPSGGWVDVLGKRALKLMNLKAVEEGNGSGGTRAGN